MSWDVTAVMSHDHQSVSHAAHDNYVNRNFLAIILLLLATTNNLPVSVLTDARRIIIDKSRSVWAYPEEGTFLYGIRNQ